MELTDFEGKEIATLLTPTTLALVTAVDADGDCVATCAWANPLSHEPSLIGVCLRPGGRTAQAIVEGGCFCVNVLPKGTKKLAAICGAKGQGQPERFEAAGLTKLPAREVAATRVAEAMSWIECEFVEHRAYGDHELYVGSTLAAQSRGGQPLLMQGRASFGCFAAE